MIQDGPTTIPFDVVSSAYKLRPHEQSLVESAARAVQERHPTSADAIISTVVKDQRRQCDLLSCVSYYLAASTMR